MCVYIYIYILYIYRHTHILCLKVRDRGRYGERDRGILHLLVHSQMAKRARARPVLSQEPRAKSFFWVWQMDTGAQTPGAASAAFPDYKQGDRSGSAEHKQAPAHGRLVSQAED